MRSQMETGRYTCDVSVRKDIISEPWQKSNVNRQRSFATIFNRQKNWDWLRLLPSSKKNIVGRSDLTLKNPNSFITALFFTNFYFVSLPQNQVPMAEHLTTKQMASVKKSYFNILALFLSLEKIDSRFLRCLLKWGFQL